MPEEDDEEPVPVAGLLESVGEGSDAEPVPGTMVRWVEHLPSRVVRSAALAMAAGVEPQFVYCCMWMALVSRSKTAVHVGVSTVSVRIKRLRLGGCQAYRRQTA